jgi:hypothetical protein
VVTSASVPVGDGVDVDHRLVADVDAHHLVLADLRFDFHVGEAAHQHHHVLGEIGAADALADLVAQLEHGAVDGRGEGGAREVVERLLELALALLDQFFLAVEAALIDLERGLRLVEIGAAGQPAFDQLLHPLQIALLLRDRAFDLPDLRLGRRHRAPILRDQRLQEALVDLPEHLPAAHAIALLDREREQIARDVGRDLHRLARLQVPGRRHGADDGALLRHRGGHFHGRRRMRPQSLHGGEAHQRDHDRRQYDSSLAHLIHLLREPAVPPPL